MKDDDGNPDHLRGLRPRLRSAVVRGQRQRGAECRDGRRRLAAREQRRRFELQRRRRCPRGSSDRAESGRGHHEGVLGRRDDPDLHQPQPAEERRAADVGVVPDLRGGPHRGPQRLRGRHRPGEPGQAGRPQDHEQGGAAERRRLRLAPSEPQRRRRRRAAAAVPVRRRHAEPGDRAVALLRAARLPAGHGRPEEQRQHACDVRDGRSGREAQEQRQGPAGDRHRADAVVPDGHARPDERARADPLRPRRGRREAPGSDDPRYQRLPRPADPARRGLRRQPGDGSGVRADLRDRRLGVPQEVVRALRGRGRAHRPARGRDRDGCR